MSEKVSPTQINALIVIQETGWTDGIAIATHDALVAKKWIVYRMIGRDGLGPWELTPLGRTKLPTSKGV